MGLHFSCPTVWYKLMEVPRLLSTTPVSLWASSRGLVLYERNSRSGYSLGCGRPQHCHKIPATGYFALGNSRSLKARVQISCNSTGFLVLKRMYRVGRRGQRRPGYYEYVTQTTFDFCPYNILVTPKSSWSVFPSWFNHAICGGCHPESHTSRRGCINHALC
jgi:hypothetical protein